MIGMSIRVEFGPDLLRSFQVVHGIAVQFEFQVSEPNIGAGNGHFWVITSVQFLIDHQCLLIIIQCLVGIGSAVHQPKVIVRSGDGFTGFAVQSLPDLQGNQTIGFSLV